MKQRFVCVLSLGILLTLSSSLFGVTGEIEASIPNRSPGIYSLSFGLLGDPFPNPFGIGFAYNAVSFARLSAVYGGGFVSNLPDIHSIGVGAVFYFPNRDFSPTGGVHWASVINGINPLFGGVGRNLYFSLGLDWQLKNGLGFEAGFNIPAWAGAGGTPYVRASWSFL